MEARNSSPQTVEREPYVRIAIGNWTFTMRRDIFHDGLLAIAVCTGCAAAGWLAGFSYGRDK